MPNEFVARNGVIAQNNSTVSGSLVVTNGVTGSLLGTSSYANNADTLDGLDSSVFTSTSSFQNYTSSASAGLTALNAQTASLLNYTSSNSMNVAALFAASASLNASVAGLNTQTSSLNASVASLNAQTASLLNYTSSNAMNIASLFATSASLNANVAGLNLQTASLLTYTSSNNTTNNTQNTRLSALEAATSSIYNTTSSLNASVTSLNSYTSSTDAKIASIYSTTSSLNTRVGTLETYTSSLNNKTSSFATTGSNTFNGTQTITGSILQSGNFTSTGTITAQTLVVQTITSSQDFVTGSTRFGSLTSNTHQFTGSVSASGSLNINNGVLFAGGTNVGIGTTSPTDTLNYGRALDIQSSTGAAIYLRDSSNTALYGLMAYDGDATNRTSIGGFGTGNYIRLISEGNEAIRIVGGNVGIGATSPGSLLQLGDYSGNPTLTFAATADGINKINFYDSNNTEGLYIRTDGESYGGTMTFGARWDDDEGKIAFKMYQTSAGGSYNARVGIGTTSPGSDLHIKGSNDSGADFGAEVRVWENAYGASLQGSTQGNTAAFVGNFRYNFTTAGSSIQNYPNAGQGILFKDGIHVYSSNPGGSGGGTFTPSERVTINTSGNVGIGTTSPIEKLDVRGGAYINGGTNDNPYDATLYITAASSNDWGVYISKPSHDYGLISLVTNSADYGLSVFDGTTHNFRVKGNGTTLIQGSVGIGTTSPTARLHISGDGSSYNLLRLNHNGTGTNGFLDISVTDTRATIATNYSSTNIPLEIKSYGNTNQLFLATGGNIGIGTSNPQTELHIAGISGWAELRLAGSTAGSGGSLEFYSGSVQLGDIYMGSSKDLTFRVNGASTVMYIKSDGNVGIGTTSPSSPLHVYKDAGDGNSIMRLRNTNSTFRTTLLQFEDYAGAYADGLIAFNVKSGAAAGSYLGIGVSTTGSLVVAYGGNVGIATTSPSAILHVQGLGASPNADSVYITNKRGGYFPLRVLVTQGDYQGVLIEHEDGTGSGGPGPYGTYGFKFDDKRTQNTYTAHPSASFVIARSSTYNNTNIFEVRPYNSAPAIAVATGGNVGIGTTSPSVKLHVNGQQYLGTASSTTGQLYLFNSGNDTRFDILNNGSEFKFAATYLSSAGYMPITFYTGDTERMRIKADGNVGIGTTDPNTLLVVRKAVNSEWIAKFINTGTNPYGMYVDTSANTSGTYTFAAYTYGGTGLFVINNTGNVGIGTTAPNAKLHVAGLVNIYPASTDGELNISQAASSGGTTTVVLRSNGGSYFNGGNVGIGTTSPTQLLDVRGKIYSISSGTDGGEIRLANSGGGSTWYWAARTTGLNLGELAAADGRIFIANGGNVGIGTTSPGRKLHVVGDANIGGSIVMGGISDAGGLGTGVIYMLEGQGIAWYNSAFNTGRASIQGTSAGHIILAPTANVGIGTTSPAAPLQVNGIIRVNATSGNGYQIFDGATERMHIYHNSSINGIEFNTGATSNANMLFYVNGTSAIRINSSGNVGINTTAPTEKLQVDGYILNRSKFGYTTTPDIVKRDLQLYIDFNNKTCWDGNVSSTSIKDLSNNNYSMALYNSATISNKDGNYALYTANNSSYLRAINYYVANQEHTWEAWVNGAAFSGWDTVFDSGNERPLIGTYDGNFQMYPDSSPNKVLTAGKWYHLVIAMNSSKSYNMYVNGTYIGNATYSQTIRTGTFDLWIGGDQSAETFNGYISIARTYNRQLSSAEVMQNYNAEKWRFDNNSTFYHDVATGNVGIGTTSPSNALDVVKAGVNAIRVQNTANTSDAYFIAQNTGGSAFFGINATGPYIYTAAALNFTLLTNNAERMRITSAGNVGIGTTSPSSKLHVKGVLSIERSDAAQISTISNEGGNFYISSASGFNTIFQDGSTERMRISTSGNVGIGTTSPSSKLEVYTGGGYLTVSTNDGAGSYDGFGLNFRIANASQDLVQFRGVYTDSGAGGTGGLNILTKSQGTLYSRIYITGDSSAYVGIGTTGPSYKLDVVGTIRASGDVIAYSDARVKENVNTITDALTKVTSLRGVSYTRNDSEDKSEKVGVIAQEVLEVLPQVVQQDDNGNYSVAYGNIVGVLIEAIKELKAEIDILKNK